METTNEMVAELESKGYIIKKSISGYYRLFDSKGNIVADDSACDDYYDYDSSIYMFYTLIFDNK